MGGEVLAGLAIVAGAILGITCLVATLAKRKSTDTPSARWPVPEQSPKSERKPTGFPAPTRSLLEMTPDERNAAIQAIADYEPEIERGPNGRVVLRTHMLPEPYEVILHYRDSKGKVTERPVTAIKLDYQSFGDDGTEFVHLGGHCHVRDRYRTFKKDRIIAAFDARTGEQLVDPLRDVLVRSLAAYDGKAARPV
jgi:hypothetical protein